MKHNAQPVLTSGQSGQLHPYFDAWANYHIYGTKIPKKIAAIRPKCTHAEPPKPKRVKKPKDIPVQGPVNDGQFYMFIVS